MHFDFRRFGQIIQFTAPLILGAAGVPSEATNLVIHGIEVAEHISNGQPKTGVEKKALALDIINTGLAAVNEAKPGTVDVGQVIDAASNGIDATIAAIKAAKNIPVKP